ncbi:MAG: glycosyltransferase family 2 protein [Microscillaceae bacterium]|nr:glycosyltransferase family 2 protein [Microscillaceae bacterium]
MLTDKNPVPICLFTFNRLHNTIETLNALKKNYLAQSTPIFIFSDGPRNETEADQIYQVRQFLESVKGFQSIEIIKQASNQGLARSIIKGVSEVIALKGALIVMEDDLLTSPNFCTT